MYKRPIFHKIIERLKEPRSFIQVLSGPRQIGKTTLAHQIKNELTIACHYASADIPTLQDLIWITEQWEVGRQLAQETNNPLGTLLILDEIQKIPHWSDIVKKLWDEDTAQQLNLKILILGSSSLLIQTGLGESLAGRFELIPMSHWSYEECREAFGCSLEQYIFFGGYPGAAGLINDEERWARYIIDSLIETSISRDIMLMTRIHKPALLRRLFELGCHHTGHVLSYQQMIGQLQDVGNVTTIAHYLDLLSGAGLIAGLAKFSLLPLKQKASSPKFQVLNTALTTAQSQLPFENVLNDKEKWGKLILSSVGAHLLNTALGTCTEIFYWKEGGNEVDFVVRRGKKILVIAVNTPHRKASIQGIRAFSHRFEPQKILIVGNDGIPLEEFLRILPNDWF